MTLRDLLTMSRGLEWNGRLRHRRSTKRHQPDGSQRRLGAIHDRQAHGRRTGQGLELQRRRYRNCSPISFRKKPVRTSTTTARNILFAPLGIRHEWKRTYLGVVDTEGGLYLTGSDLAKIGYLYLHDGMWDGQRIVSSKWVKESVTPYFQTEPSRKSNMASAWPSGGCPNCRIPQSTSGWAADSAGRN